MNAVLTEDPTPPTELTPGLPEEVDDVVLRALAKERADRYEDVLYLRDRLAELYDSS